MKVTVIGTGYVGLVSAVGLAEIGHKIFCIDIDKEKIKTLQRGQAPFFEPKLEQLLKKNIKAGKIFFSDKLSDYLNKSDLVFICVGTPPKKNGSADLSYLVQAVTSIKKLAKKGMIVVTKSTVPVGTGEMIEKLLNKNGKKFQAVSCPEFLREGKAIEDFFRPDRIVVGHHDKQIAEKVMKLFAKIKAHKVITDRATAELIKYASNAFLATKISFINEIANMCDRVGANVQEVARGMGLDKRINPYFLKAGIGYGGSCFPKDVRALRQLAGGTGYNFRLLKAVIEVNNKQRKIFIDKIKKNLEPIENKVVTVLGLAFKDSTDDVRESASLDIVKSLQKDGVTVRVFDPEAMPNAKKILNHQTIYCQSVYEALKDSEALILATEWPEFGELDWLKVKKIMKKPVIFDGKNLIEDNEVRKLGFKYFGVGK